MKYETDLSDWNIYRLNINLNILLYNHWILSNQFKCLAPNVSHTLEMNSSMNYIFIFWQSGSIVESAYELPIGCWMINGNTRQTRHSCKQQFHRVKLYWAKQYVIVRMSRYVITVNSIQFGELFFSVALNLLCTVQYTLYRVKFRWILDSNRPAYNFMSPLHQ